MRTWLACILAALVTVPALVLAQSQGPASVRDQVESSMVLTGTIDIAPDGSVSTYSIDRVDDIPPGVRELFEKFTPGWRFEPVLVDGQPVRAHARMSVRVVAKRQDGDRYRVSIRDTRFGQDEPGENVTGSSMQPPVYPMVAAQADVSGTVYIVVRVGRDGRAMDTAVEQVNLRFVASERVMKRWRKMLSRSALGAAKSWTFNPPTSGDTEGDDSWLVRVPVDFTFERDDPYGRWQTYVPGPYKPSPWAGVHLAGSPDALPASGVFQVGRELKLLTPTGGD